MGSLSGPGVPHRVDARRAAGLGLRLGLAHHPLCSAYRDDVVRVGGLALCSGCVATWPAFLLAFPLALQARLALGAEPLALLAAGLALGLPQMASYFWRRSRAERATAKLAGGVGLALVAAGGLTAGWPLATLAAVAVAGVGASLALQAVRLRRILATCDACPFRRDWSACPGFGALDSQGSPAPPSGPGWPTALLPPGAPARRLP